MEGFAHTLAANISPTVLPASVPPHTWTKNGRPPVGSTNTDANEAASRILAISFSDALIDFASFIHSPGSPLGCTLSNICLYEISPSYIRLSTYGENPLSAIHPRRPTLFVSGILS